VGAEDRVKRFLPFAFSFILLITTAALADITGTALVIDGVTIDIAGQRIRLRGYAARSLFM
jgi:hypothetical protein